MYFDKSAGVSKRLPIPIDDIRKVQNQCRLIDDDLRWLVALVSDTGMRLAEGAGLLKSDIILDADIPHISLKPHRWRPLKTSGSQRDIPLVGASLWAAQRPFRTALMLSLDTTEETLQTQTQPVLH